MIDGAAEHEQQIREAVYVNQKMLVDLIHAQRHDRPLGPAADGARKVKQRAGTASSWKDEPAKRRQLRLEPIDPVLDASHVGVGDDGLRRSSIVHRRSAGNLACRVGKAGADREQIFLKLLEQIDDVSSEVALCADHAEACVQLVDITISGDSRIRLRHTRAAKEAGLPLVARPRVDLHDRQYT